MLQVLQVGALSGYEPEIGCWLWALEEVRHRTLKIVDSLGQQTLDWEGPDGRENAIGSLLYHIALVEMSWLFLDILEQDLPVSVKPHFPHSMAAEGQLTSVPSVTIGEHLDRLNRSRDVLLEALGSMSTDGWKRLREPEDADYKVSPAWVVFHLIEHEAGHAAQIAALKARASRYFSSGP